MTRLTMNIAIATVIAAALTGQASAEPVKIRAGWVVAPASLIPVLFAKQGLARHQGNSYVLEPVYFSASPAQITAMSVGELEIAALGFSTVADLKGKVLATNGVGTGVHMAMRAMLQRSGLQDKRDYTVIEAPFPTMKAVLLDGKADMIVSTTPFVFDPELQARARVLFTQRDAMGTSELSFWTAREGFIRKNRAAMVDLLEDSLRALRWYLDPANRSEAIDILARFLKQPPARFEGWVFSKNDFYRNPDGLVNLDALQNNIDLMRQLGIISTDLNAASHARLDLVGEAAQRLK
jgi:sulfonate transport system substrate-binding protein